MSIDPSFLIPVGTQVVLQRPLRVPGTDESKLAGSVGEVVAAPDDNARPYLIRFVDGIELRVKFPELLVRRTDRAVEQTITPGPDVEPFVVYRVLVFLWGCSKLVGAKWMGVGYVRGSGPNS
ncbi:hypothetical protein [Fimbriiglobus ruber]|uniref:DUF4926 domain-containing protein n=1 Tax=Fimbriiglobus ruber TaxID=1908690 RepID=A0A225DC24_9BACT|nr:hypothetical protein [Fimbriiglobus ruber]OWK39140.1 hypothetical protein FRUB_06222 [Fimbriiglobus ruber]